MRHIFNLQTSLTKAEKNLPFNIAFRRSQNITQVLYFQDTKEF